MTIPEQLQQIFMPGFATKRDAHNSLEPTHSKFVHYTSAEAALNIIRSKRIWMRSTACMSDYREVQHGLDLMRRTILSEGLWQEFREALDSCVLGAADEAARQFNDDWSIFLSNTYITSFSEHLEKENAHGRLSMWRAFGTSGAGVAFVLSVPHYAAAQAMEELRTIFSPVEYLAEDQVKGDFCTVIQNVRDNADFLRSVRREKVVENVLAMFVVVGVTCLKHEGFKEEKEWRLIYWPQTPLRTPITRSTETIRGVPQIICQVPLDGSDSAELGELEFSRIFHRLIIGPSQYSGVMRDAFVDALMNAGVADARERVVTSNIPVRT